MGLSHCSHLANHVSSSDRIFLQSFIFLPPLTSSRNSVCCVTRIPAIVSFFFSNTALYFKSRLEMLQSSPLVRGSFILRFSHIFKLYHIQLLLNSNPGWILDHPGISAEYRTAKRMPLAGHCAQSPCVIPHGIALPSMYRRSQEPPLRRPT